VGLLEVHLLAAVLVLVELLEQIHLALLLLEVLVVYMAAAVAQEDIEVLMAVATIRVEHQAVLVV
jgi:hypothetical protein